MAERSSSSRSMRNRNSRCDTPSLVTSTSELPLCDEVPSAGFRYFTRSVAARSSDLEKWTNLSSTNSLGAATTSRQFQRWTSSEDRQLINGVNSGNGPPHNWKRIASDHLLNTRSPSQCKARWKNALRPDINYEPFSAEEDATILFYQRRGLGWSAIASYLPGRVAEQARDRFVNYIDPSIQTSPWTAKEDKLLTELQATHGNKWFTISMYMPGRTENSIKNRWYNRKTRQHRALRRMFAQSHSTDPFMPSTDAMSQLLSIQDSLQLCTINFEHDEESVYRRSSDECLSGVLAVKDEETGPVIYEI